jgi:2-dehydropantoate 2-reductase
VQADHLNRLGITYKDQFGLTDNVPVQAIPVTEFSGKESHCVITVKQTSIHELAFLKEEKFKNISCLFLQNGISHIPFIESLPQKAVSVGIVEHGAVKNDYSDVCHLGKGKIKIASYRGYDSTNWLSLFRDERFPVKSEDNWKEMLYEKLIMNASINPVTAMLRIPNGELVTNEYAFEIMKHLFEEVLLVLNMTNRRDELWKDLLTICRNTSLNRSSMLKSVENGQQTEIDSITGEIIDLAHNNNIHIPCSKFVYQVIKALDWRG